MWTSLVNVDEKVSRFESRVSRLKEMPLRILVTGFGSFPGARKNPTALLTLALGEHRARLARLGIALELSVLPVSYAGVARKLEELNERLKPDAILHFGLAARRKYISIETRARNRLSLLHCDASGARAPRRAIIPGAPQFARSTFPTRQIDAALRRADLRCRLSANAGNYVCNETLYLSLARSHARAIGFIHVPRLTRAERPKRVSRNRRPNLAGLTRAALIAILVTARKLRQDLAKECISMPSRHDFVRKPDKESGA
jgi:pyroglutamyl-peptidase